MTLVTLTENHRTECPPSPRSGSLTVGGALKLNESKLATLPASFGSLTVGDSLDLRSNNLATLPASFGLSLIHI